jgi:hypothetical protein
MLGLIIAAGGKGSSQASDLAAIQAVRQQDSNFAAMTAASKGLRVNSDEDLDKAGAIIKDYVTVARRIDTHSCPRDFAESYYRNITAWSDEADAILAHPAYSGNADGSLCRWVFPGPHDRRREWWNK